VALFTDDADPLPTAIDISGIGRIELEVFTDPDFGEVVRYRTLYAKTQVELFDVIRNANGDIRFYYDDGTTAVFSARGSTAALDAARKRCNATIKAFRSGLQ
jgi:hypothetical protein